MASRARDAAHRIIAEQVDAVALMFAALDAVRNDPAFSKLSPNARARVGGALRAVAGPAKPKAQKLAVVS